MIRTYFPKQEDLWFRQMLLRDEDTMSFNHAWGGTVDFPEDQWSDWYDRWVLNPEGKRFYRYLQNVETNEFIGEIAYHSNGKEYLADVLVFSKCRGNGFGKEGLRLLCDAAKHAGIQALYDDIAIDNPSVAMFLKMGFHEEYRSEEYIMLRKSLT